MQLKFEEIVELIHREMYVRNGVMLGSKAAARAIMQAEEAAQQSVQPTIATAALEDSPFETGIRRNAVVLPNRNSG